MAMSGTYVAEVPLKGSAEKHYKRWRNENHLFQDAIGQHIQGCTICMTVTGTPTAPSDHGTSHAVSSTLPSLSFL